MYATVLGQRKDSLCDVIDAVLTAEAAATLARLSLAPGFRRGWASVSDALAAGTLDLEALRTLLVARLPQPLLPSRPPPLAPPSPAAPPVPSRDDLVRPLWVGDASTWPRPEARTSPERTYCHRVTAGVPQDGIVAGWEYHWLVAVPEASGSWVLPLDVTRRAPPPATKVATGQNATGKNTPTAVVLRQLRTVLARYPAEALRPVVALDSNYDPVALARAQREPAGLAVDVVVRVAAHRVFFPAPAPYAGRGRPRVHGAVFRGKDPATHGPPQRTAITEDPKYGTVVVRAWTDLHVRTGFHLV